MLSDSHARLMTQHVFAHLAGFGLAVIPRAPYRVQRIDKTLDVIDVEYQSPNGKLFARLTPDNGGYKSQLDQHTGSLFDVLNIEVGPDVKSWRIETTIFSCCWPIGFALCSNNFPNDPGPFDLVGDNNELIYIQHPKRMPDVEQLRVAHQTVISVKRTAESESIELAYDHDGLPWHQRHEIVTLLGRRIAITMQSPSKFAERAVNAARQIAHSLAPNQSVG